MTIDGYEPDDAVPIGIFASKIKPPRTIDCLRKWQKDGVLNRFTKQKVRCHMTRLTNGGWGVSIRQYDAFIAALNQKP